MREIAQGAGLSLAKLLGDMVLVYSRQIESGYEVGTCLREWRDSAEGDEGRGGDE